MLRLERPTGSKLIIGDHTVVYILNSVYDSVTLGIESKGAVTRADSPEHMLQAARVVSRVRAAHSSGAKEMVKAPVFVAHRVDEGGVLDVRASLRKETVNFPGYQLAEMGCNTNLTPAGHDFLVIRSADTGELAGVRKLIGAKILPWRYYDTVEMPDSTLYSLFARVVPGGRSPDDGDVRYVDFTAEEISQ